MGKLLIKGQSVSLHPVSHEDGVQGAYYQGFYLGPYTDENDLPAISRSLDLLFDSQYGYSIYTTTQSIPSLEYVLASTPPDDFIGRVSLKVGATNQAYATLFPKPGSKEFYIIHSKALIEAVFQFSVFKGSRLEPSLSSPVSIYACSPYD